MSINLNLTSINQSKLSFSKWIKATFLGWFLGIFFLVGLSVILDSLGIEGFQFYIGVGLGTGVGFFQWRLLKRSIGMSQQWFWGSMVGLSLPFLIFDLVSQYSPRPLGEYYLPLSTFSGAVLTGLLQFNLLKKKSQQANRWIFGCITGWIFAGVTVLSIDYFKLIVHNNWASLIINLTMILGGGAVLGFITGKFLIAILKSQ